jgi:hypothetical protein
MTERYFSGIIAGRMAGIIVRPDAISELLVKWPIVLCRLLAPCCDNEVFLDALYKFIQWRHGYFEDH